MFDLIIFKYFKDYLDSITKMLKQGGAGFTYVAKDEEADLEIVLKLIFIGINNDNETKNNKRDTISKEIELGMMISKGCDYLILYSEIFNWKNYICIKMEYCSNGDLQTELDKERIFTEEVLILFFCKFFC
jgi:serine/threonine protein kinase